MLINNSLYTYDINIEFDYIGDFLLGNSIVKLVQDENGMIDVEGIMSETVDNLLVAQVKKYPEVLG